MLNLTAITCHVTVTIIMFAIIKPSQLSLLTERLVLVHVLAKMPTSGVEALSLGEKEREIALLDSYQLTRQIKLSAGRGCGIKTRSGFVHCLNSYHSVIN